jgi:hypothetical protein
MFVSFREAGDLFLQVSLVLGLAAGSIAAASIAAREDQIKPVLDMNRPVLWTAAPVRIDTTMQAYLREDMPQHLALADNYTCRDAIGLRMPCDLIPLSSRLTF